MTTKVEDDACPDCGSPIWSGHCCRDDFDQGDCWWCAGEGYVFDCFDGLCVNAEDGCDLCMRRCDVCNRPSPPKPSQHDEGPPHDR